MCRVMEVASQPRPCAGELGEAWPSARRAAVRQALGMASAGDGDGVSSTGMSVGDGVSSAGAGIGIGVGGRGRLCAGRAREAGW